MKKTVCIALLVLVGCALRPSWHWEQDGASDTQYTADLNYCKGASYPLGGDGMVTKEMVGRMHACMEAHGWHKAPN